MGRNSRVTSVRAVLAGSVIACFVFGQATVTRQEMESLRQQAEAAAAHGEWSDAASLYRSAMPWEQGSTWAHVGLADVYRANGVWDKAAEQYEAASAIDRSDEGTKQLAALSRQALAEERAGFVKTGTFRALAQFPWTWLRSGAGPSRDLTFQPKTQATIAQRIPIQAVFPRDKFTLDSLPAGTTRQLEEVAEMIRTSADRPLKIEVEGNTCRCGADAANLELGRKRAEAVREFLISMRAAPAERITTISFGSSRPVESSGAPSLPATVCERDAIHSQNRRVVIVVYGQAKVLTEKTTPHLDVTFQARRAGSKDYEPLPEGGRLRSGDEYRIRLRAESAVYAYAFHHGSSGNWEVLFPADAGGRQSERFSNPLEAGQDLSIPTADAGLVLDDHPGTEETYVYSSQGPNVALETLIRNIQEGAVELAPPPLAGTTVRTQKPQTGDAVAPKPPAGGSSNTVPQPKSQEGEDRIKMKDLVPRLPPDPAAHIKFQHLQ